jgi:phosphoribosylaminoimidazole-succinocarboxamide synthase
MNTKRTRIYEGKAKILYEGPEPGTIIVHYKDDTTAFDATKKAVIDGKGVLNNRISELIFQRLNDLGMPTHFLFLGLVVLNLVGGFQALGTLL